MNISQIPIADRVRQTRRLMRSEGLSGISDRLRTRAAATLAPSGNRIPISKDDLLKAAELDHVGWTYPAPLPSTGGPLSIAWVTTPPAQGSGGHTTMFRMANALTEAGHKATIYLFDRHGGSIEQQRRSIRKWWPWANVEVEAFEPGIQDCHAIFATGWETAYALLGSDARGVRCYFVQDFEPAFAPAGSEYLLAEATYTFGFQGVTAGRWLAEKLTKEYGMQADHFPFGCDLDSYHLNTVEGVERNGISYYCRPSTPRRAHELAMVALDLFASWHPDVPIHFFGETVKSAPFPLHHHGLLSPDELGSLYNRCIAGLVLSATNVSLVPHEMLAAGCIPVVNDAPQNRSVLDNPHVAYSRATPFDLAKSLSRLVQRHKSSQRLSATFAAAASRSVKSISWDESGGRFERIVSNLVARHQRPTETREPLASVGLDEQQEGSQSWTC